MPDERFLVTGGTGCLGSWVVRNLVRAAVPVTILVHAHGLERLRLLLTDDEVVRVGVIEADLCDLEAIEAGARRARVTTLIHLAGLQLPLCAADPIAGARVNVQGTATMFELARRLDIGRLVYASSAAVYGPRARYADEIVGPDAERYPTSHYGVFKVANEQGATVAWETQGVASIGLRPHSVYGPGRDQGVTSKPTVAMVAAAAGRPFRIGFSGRYQFQFADDAARAFVAAARARIDGAPVFSIGGPLIGVDEIVAAIEAVEPAARGQVTVEERSLPFPAGFDGEPLEAALGVQPVTPLADGVRTTIETYRRALADGRLDGAFLDRVLAG